MDLGISREEVRALGPGQALLHPPCQHPAEGSRAAGWRAGWHPTAWPGPRGRSTRSSWMTTCCLRTAAPSSFGPCATTLSRPRWRPRGRAPCASTCTPERWELGYRRGGAGLILWGLACAMACTGAGREASERSSRDCHAHAGVGCLSPVASPPQCCLPRMPSRAPPAQASVSLPRVGSAEALRFQGKYEESRDGLDCAAVFDGGAFRLHLVSASLKTLRCAGVGKGGGGEVGLAAGARRSAVHVGPPSSPPSCHDRDGAGMHGDPAGKVLGATPGAAALCVAAHPTLITCHPPPAQAHPQRIQSGDPGRLAERHPHQDWGTGPRCPSGGVHAHQARRANSPGSCPAAGTVPGGGGPRRRRRHGRPDGGPGSGAHVGAD